MQARDDRRSVALVGLGLMGFSIARRLIERGYAVTGADVSEVARDLHSATGYPAHRLAADAVRDCSIVLLSLPDGAVSRSACLDEGGILEGAEPGTLVIDTTTSRPEEAEALGEAVRAAGLWYVDAGLSGSSAMVARGEGIAVVGGGVGEVEASRPVLADICGGVFHVGGPGAGMRAKLVINLVLAVNRVAVAEALTLTERLGMEPGVMLEILRSSAANSTAMEIWGDRMVGRHFADPTSRVRQHVKDAEHILELARSVDSPTPLMGRVGELAHIAMATGLADADNSAVVEVLRSMAGLDR